MSIEQNLQQIQHRIKKACQQAGRSSSSVRLLAASKRTDAGGVQEAIGLGQLLFGENRAQSLRDKYDAVAPNFPQAEWHFIGYLQKNKIKYIVGRATTVHSVDSLDLAEAIAERIASEREKGKELPDMKILVQVKLGNEESKTGCPKEQVLELCHSIHKIDNLELCGLMCIPPLYGDPRQWFQEMVSLAEQGKSLELPLTELSMGMSGDMEEAIACGATMVRVGTDIFK